MRTIFCVDGWSCEGKGALDVPTLMLATNLTPELAGEAMEAAEYWNGAEDDDGKAVVAFLMGVALAKYVWDRKEPPLSN